MPVRCFQPWGSNPGDTTWFNTDDVVLAHRYVGQQQGGPYTLVCIHRNGRDQWLNIIDPPEAIFNSGPE